MPCWLGRFEADCTFVPRSAAASAEGVLASSACSFMHDPRAAAAITVILLKEVQLATSCNAC